MSGAVKSAVILGATSGIAEAIARLYAEEGARLTLVARDKAKADEIAADLSARGAEQAHVVVQDFAGREDMDAKFAAILDAAGHRVDVALLAYGNLPDQAACEADVTLAAKALDLNFVSAAEWLTLFANQMERQGSGTLAAITSVAADRGRASNYVYGSAKAGLKTFLEGLRHRLASKGVGVTEIRPGFVDTPMTAHLEKNPLFAPASAVAERAKKGIDKQKAVVYTPAFWALIMLVIKLMPRTIFHRMKF